MSTLAQRADGKRDGGATRAMLQDGQMRAWHLRSFPSSASPVHLLPASRQPGS